MGYELNIVRKKDWSNANEESNVSLEEWLKYAEQDNELTVSAEPNMFDWTNYPCIQENGIPWFQYSNGYIRTKNPDISVIKKMLTMAQALDAKVQGEEGEFYDENFLEAFL